MTKEQAYLASIIHPSLFYIPLKKHKKTSLFFLHSKRSDQPVQSNTQQYISNSALYTQEKYINQYTTKVRDFLFLLCFIIIIIIFPMGGAYTLQST